MVRVIFQLDVSYYVSGYGCAFVWVKASVPSICSTCFACAVVIAGMFGVVSHQPSAHSNQFFHVDYLMICF